MILLFQVTTTATNTTTTKFILHYR
jgi:hypothetical protein